MKTNYTKLVEKNSVLLVGHSLLTAGIVQASYSFFLKN